MPLRFCANLGFLFGELNLIDSYHAAKKLGFRGVEVGNPYTSPVEVIQRTTEQLGLEHVQINVPWGLVSLNEVGFAAVPGKSAVYMDGLKKALSYAEALRCTRIHVMSGCVEHPTAEHEETYKSNILNACRLFGDAGITALIEPITQRALPNYYMDSYKRAMEIIQFANSPYLKLQLDIFHLQHILGDLTQNIKEMLPYVGHIQIAQVPFRNEPDTEGEINYKYILDLLDKEGYRGWIGLEYKPKTNTADGLKWIKNFGLSL